MSFSEVVGMSTSVNPLGLEGIEFVEYSSTQPQQLVELFTTMGFQKVAAHKRKKVDLYRQGRINFILNREPNTFADQFAKAHGPSICAMGLRVKDAKTARDQAVRRGARAIDIANDPHSHS